MLSTELVSPAGMIYRVGAVRTFDAVRVTFPTQNKGDGEVGNQVDGKQFAGIIIISRGDRFLHHFERAHFDGQAGWKLVVSQEDKLYVFYNVWISVHAGRDGAIRIDFASTAGPELNELHLRAH